MGHIVVEYPRLHEKLTWSHPLLRLVMLKSLKAQGVIPEPVYMRCLAQLQLPESYGALKERMAGDCRYEADH